MNKFCRIFKAAKELLRPGYPLMALVLLVAFAGFSDLASATHPLLQDITMDPAVPRPDDIVTFQARLHVAWGTAINVRVNGGIDESQVFSKDFAELRKNATRNLKFAWKAVPGLHKAWFEIDKNSKRPDGDPGDNRVEVAFLVRADSSIPLFSLPKYDLNFSPALITKSPAHALPGSRATFTAKFISKGGKCENLTVIGGVDGVKLYEKVFATAHADQVQTASFDWPAVAGIHSVWFKLDPEHKTRDTDFTNNKLQGTFIISSELKVSTTATTQSSLLTNLAIHVSSPAEGEDWTTGQIRVIAWGPTISGKSYRIDLYSVDENKLLLPITPSIAANSFSWKIPSKAYQFPGNCKVRVAATSGGSSGFSEAFHISLATTIRTYTVKGETINGYRICSGCSIPGYTDNVWGSTPGPGMVYIGFENRYRDNDYFCGKAFRTYIKFDVSQFKNKGLLQSAKISFGEEELHRFCDGVQTKKVLFILDWPWGGDVWNSKGYYLDGWEDNVTPVVRKWIAFDDANYGCILDIEDWLARCRPNNCFSVAIYKSVSLVLQFIEEQ
jgi:hypothetical protein